MISKLIKAPFVKIGHLYIEFRNKRDFNLQKFVSLNERPVELSFLFRKLIPIWPKTILDVGTGITSLPHILRTCGFLVTAIDNKKDYWPFGMINRHYHVLNDDITKSKLRKKFDFITCISVLEHIKDHNAAIKNITMLLNSGGYLVLTCPYNEKIYIENVYNLPESEVKDKYFFTTQSFSRKEINFWVNRYKLKIISQEYWKYYSGKFWTCGKKLKKPKKTKKNETHQLTCILFKKI